MYKSFQFDTTLPCHTEVVPTWHDFCPVILKSCQLGTTSATSYFYLFFLKKLLFIYWVVSYIMLKVCIHETLNIKIYFLASGKHVRGQCPQELMAQSLNKLIIQIWSIHDYPIFCSLKLTLLENYVSKLIFNIT